MKEEYVDAEIFLKAVTHFYPRFAEGWAILHLLYVKIQYYPGNQLYGRVIFSSNIRLHTISGIDLTLDIAEKCLKDRVREKETFDLLCEEPMAWSAMLGRSNQIFLLTTVLLLKLNLYNVINIHARKILCAIHYAVIINFVITVRRFGFKPRIMPWRKIS